MRCVLQDLQVEKEDANVARGRFWEAKEAESQACQAKVVAQQALADVRAKAAQVSDCHPLCSDYPSQLLISSKSDTLHQNWAPEPALVQ